MLEHSKSCFFSFWYGGLIPDDGVVIIWVSLRVVCLECMLCFSHFFGDGVRFGVVLVAGYKIVLLSFEWGCFFVCCFACIWCFHVFSFVIGVLFRWVTDVVHSVGLWSGLVTAYFGVCHRLSAYFLGVFSFRLQQLVSRCFFPCFSLCHDLVMCHVAKDAILGPNRSGEFMLLGLALKRV